MSTENWLPVRGWECLYEVSDAGRVRSVSRDVPSGRGTRRVRGRVLIAARGAKGYRRVSLSDRDRRAAAAVHRLVLEAFDRSRPPGLQIRHLDGDPGNNTAANLAWGTGTENWADRHRHGTAHRSLARGTCPHGHPWTETNTYLRHGSPVCRTCRREGMRRRTA